MSNKNRFIAIEGVIGVGKTTLARLLRPYFNASVLLEVFEENPFLADFYADRDRYAFQTQLFFLLSRYQQQNKAVPSGLQLGNLISDYTFAKDELFAWLNLKDDELAMYGRVHSALSEKIKRPDLLVYLVADHDVVMQRIAQRDRPYERDMDPVYIQQLAAAYDAWLLNMNEIEVLKIDVSQLDFISKQADLEHVAGLIEARLREIEEARQAAVPDSLRDASLLPTEGNLAIYQEFHMQLDVEKLFDPDLFYNYILLTEEMGELGQEMAHAWINQKHWLKEGLGPIEAQKRAIEQHKQKLGEELADLLAYLLKLSNYLGINLEDAYLTKMNHNKGREWNF